MINRDSGNYLTSKTILHETFYVSKAKELLKKSSSLNILEWCDFEKLIAELLKLDGWNIYHTKLTRDGGVDIIATRKDKRLGLFKVIWQIKRYKKANPVGVKSVRELGFLISNSGASRGVIVTTSRLTKDALKLIKEHEYIMSGIDGDEVESWIYEHGEDDDGKDLPF